MTPQLRDPEDEQFRELFKTASYPIADDGFSDRVLSGLPARSAASSRATVLALSGAAAGTLIAIIQIVTHRDITGSTAAVGESLEALQHAFSGPAVPLAFCVTAIALGISWGVIHGFRRPLRFR